MNEELKKRLEGQGDLLDVSVVSGGVSKIEETIDKPENETSSEIRVNILEEGPYKELAYLCMQSDQKSFYIEKLEKVLDKVLVQHDFNKEESHYERVRDGTIDYLFLKYLGNTENKGTFGISLEFKENPEFEGLLDSSMRKLRTYDRRDKVLSSFFGTLSGLVIGVATAVIFFQPDYLGYSIIAGGGGIGGLSGPSLEYYISRLNKKNVDKSNDELKEKHDEFIKKYETLMLTSPKQYDLKILNHFLNLTPDFIVNKNE